MTESLDHMKGRLDALIDFAKRLREELEGREQERVNRDVNERHDKAMDAAYPKCPKCGKHGIPLGGVVICDCTANPPAPTTIKWVVWEYSRNYYHSMEGNSIVNCFTRKKIGEIQVRPFGDKEYSIAFYDAAGVFKSEIYHVEDYIAKEWIALLDRVGERVTI